MPPNGKGLGGYLGVDSSGTLGWALAKSTAWTEYAVEFNMKQATSLGAATTLYCKEIANDPAPSGGTFGSGAPSIATDANRIAVMVLVGQ